MASTRSCSTLDHLSGSVSAIDRQRAPGDGLATNEIREVSDRALLLARFGLDVLRQVLTLARWHFCLWEISVLINLRLDRDIFIDVLNHLLTRAA
ncbi:hypothetical protein ACF09H_21665 [Streptomyces sp. NPDC014983]|uniref:hypothetical protein n=1 Tax=Streptomyces sp. NPDC014983 TaxID=3364933 RepID=UPI00370269DC